jgi:hypothetical protein
LLTSFAGLGRRATVCAFYCATLARYSGLPPQVAALRRNSRDYLELSRVVLHDDMALRQHDPEQ